MSDSLLSNLTADEAHRCNRRHWLADDAFADAAGRDIADWLTDTGWMTKRLRQLCGDAFRFDVIGIGSVRLGSLERELLETADESAVCREIEFRLEKEPLLFAQVVLTRPTASKQAWLHSRELKPLGDELAERQDVERSDFRFALIDGDDPLYQRALRRSSYIDKALWLRQSVVSIGGALILINEVFLPALWRVAAQI